MPSIYVESTAESSAGLKPDAAISHELNELQGETLDLRIGSHRILRHIYRTLERVNHSLRLPSAPGADGILAPA